MKSLILTIAIAFSALFLTAQPLEAKHCSKKKKVCTTEVCRRHYTEEKGHCHKRCVTFVEITYVTTYVDCNEKYSTEKWTKTEKVKVEKGTCCN